jgi:glutamine amidotransferase
MCRHLAYLGPPLTLASLLHDAPHSLEAQAHWPRHQREGATNAHGWGVGWWGSAVSGAPDRYRSTEPIWTDESFRATADAVRTSALAAAARNATPGLEVVETGNAPFASDRWLFSLNGFVTGFQGAIGDDLRALVSTARAERIEGTTDSEVLFALVLDALDAGATAAEAISSVTATVLARTDGKINLLLTDGTSIVASACGNSLFTLHDDGLAAGGVLVASEPLDDNASWTPVPPNSVVVATVAELHHEPLESAEGVA